MADQFIMTQKGYEDAVERLKYLQTVKRQEIVERIAEARSHGDLSENAEYDAYISYILTDDLNATRMELLLSYASSAQDAASFLK